MEEVTFTQLFTALFFKILHSILEPSWMNTLPVATAFAFVIGSVFFLRQFLSKHLFASEFSRHFTWQDEQSQYQFNFLAKTMDFRKLYKKWRYHTGLCFGAMMGGFVLGIIVPFFLLILMDVTDSGFVYEQRNSIINLAVYSNLAAFACMFAYRICIAVGRNFQQLAEHTARHDSEKAIALGPMRKASRPSPDARCFDLSPGVVRDGPPEM